VAVITAGYYIDSECNAVSLTTSRHLLYLCIADEINASVHTEWSEEWVCRVHYRTSK